MFRWGEWGSVAEHQRYKQPVRTSRRCWCGCKRKATHAGFCNGVAMTAPLCELAARRWEKFGFVRKNVS